MALNKRNSRVARARLAVRRRCRLDARKVFRRRTQFDCLLTSSSRCENWMHITSDGRLSSQNNFCNVLMQFVDAAAR